MGDSAHALHYGQLIVNRGNGNLEWKEETESWNGKRKREMVVNTFSRLGAIT